MEEKHKNVVLGCQNCKTSFIIEPDDFSFYEKIGVPAPTFCPHCRQIRRYVWRNERTLYRRACDATGKSIVSIYSPDSPYKVFDIKYWWGDEWDPKAYGRDVDFTRSFFEQWRELQLAVPRIALLNKNCVNSDFCNHSNDSKDCYMSTTAFSSENVMYSSNVIPLKNGSDCYKIYGKSNENLYECIDIHNAFNCQYCMQVTDSFDCFYSFDLKNCSNCFLSYNLRGQSYYFMNEKCTKEEYAEKIKAFDLSSYTVREDLYNKWKEIIFEKALQRGMLIDTSVDCTGSMIAHSKNAKNCFDAEDMEDCSYVDFTINGLKDSRDIYHVGVQSELLYESHAMVRSSNVQFSHLSYDNTNMQYCDSCHNSNELFGCVGVKKGSYMILNKQYSKEEYVELKAKLIEHMKETGEYGEFFPVELSPFAYNETQAQVYFPMVKEDALQRGFRWKDDMPGTYGKETVAPENIPDKITDIPDSFTKEIFRCVRTDRNYNVPEFELAFYRQHNIPFPRLYPDERYKDRIHLRPERRLYDGVCAVSGTAIKVAYPPDYRPKMIVSDEVYKKEVL